MAFLVGTVFDFYFDRFTMDTSSTDEFKDCVKVKGAMLEKFSVRKREYEIMKEASSQECDGSDMQTFLSRADKLYLQEKFNQQANFGLL